MYRSRWLTSFNHLTFLWISLNVGVGVIINSATTQAAPNPVFKNVLTSARQQLPQGLKLRLPALLADGGTPLYAFIKSDQQKLQVFLSNNPGCNQPNCSVGVIAMFNQQELARWYQKRQNATSIKLPQGITGYYLVQGKGNQAAHYILWQQDKTGYVIGTGQSTISRSQLEQIAASMVNEAPIP